MAKDLRTYLEAVKAEGDTYYREIDKEVSTYLEPFMVQQKLATENRFPVLFYNNVEGSEHPLVTNTFGSYELMGLALDMSPKNTNKKDILQEYIKRSANMIDPVEITDAPSQEVVLTGDQVDLSVLPITHHAVGDHGKYITAGFTVCKHPDNGIYNVGWYRHEVLSKNSVSCMINPNNHGKYIARRNAELGQDMEVALVIGHHPAATMGTCVSGSIDMDEYKVMGGLLNEPLRLVKAKTVDLLVPADAEVILEGVIHPNEECDDGPFAEFAGYYGRVMPAYTIEIKAITMRKDAIWHDLDPAHPEHNLSGVLSFESAHYNAIKRVVPSVTGVHLPPSGCCMFTVYIQIRKRVMGEANLAALAALSGVFMCKTVIVVDEDIDIYNEREVMWAVATRVQADKNVNIIPWVSGSHLDPLAYDESRLGKGSMTTKVIIDATKPLQTEFADRVKPPKEMLESIDLTEYLK